MKRVPVLNKEGIPLMPMKASRVAKFLESGKAVKKWSKKLNLFYIQLTVNESGQEAQPIAVGIDPGKSFSGLAVQSKKVTHVGVHAILPFNDIRSKKETQSQMRRTRRGRRIDRKKPFVQRSHHQKRFNNRRSKKTAPSIKANKQLEQSLLNEFLVLFPISDVYYEVIKAKGDKGFSPAMVGQKEQCKWMQRRSAESNFEFHTQFGYETSKLRKYLELPKNKEDKSAQEPTTHATDAISLASSRFIRYQATFLNSMGWAGYVEITGFTFVVVSRPPVSRRQLHLLQESKKGNRRKYGGTTLEGSILRKGDFVKVKKNAKNKNKPTEIFFGYVSGKTKKLISVSDFEWKRLGQNAASGVTLIRRSSGFVQKVEFIKNRPIEKDHGG